MTILTAPQPSKQDEKVANSVKDVSGDLDAEKVESQADGFHYSSSDYSAVNHSNAIFASFRRRRLVTTLCAVLLILWLLLAASIGGILLFRYFHRRNFTGWCGADMITDGNVKQSERLQQRIEIDHNYEYEKVEVPRFGENRPAVFVHDFKQNLTAIVDIKGHQCFIKPLDRKHITPPKSFVDLVRKMQEGYYEQQSDIVHEHFTARSPPMSSQELIDLGSWMIVEQCQFKISYMLEKEAESLSHEKVVAVRRKRNIQSENFVKFIPEHGVVQYSIGI